MKRILLAAVLSLPAALMAVSPVAANDAASPSDKLSLTIYGDGRALVDDERTVSFKMGDHVIELPGVSSAILAQSVTVKSTQMDILEQNFDFDLLTPAKLMEKAVGQYVDIVRINPATGSEETQRAKILSVNNGVVMQIGSKIEVLRDDKIPTRVIFPEVPDNLKASPTLSLRVDSKLPGRRGLNLSYLTGGINWNADYVAMFDESGKRMDLQGWATLENLTQTSFQNAELSVMAGYVGDVNGNNYFGYNNRSPYWTLYNQSRNQLRNRLNQNRNLNFNRNNQRKAGIEASPQERVGDNLLYRLPVKTSLAANQKKQITIVDAADIKAEKAYEFYHWGFRSLNDPQNVDSRIRFSNSRAAGLGEALPSGTVRVYTKDKNGKAQFIGEESIAHIAGGSDMSLKIGEAFDITVKPTLVSSKNISQYVTDYQMKYELKNASKKAVDVSVFQAVYGYRNDYDFKSESQRGEMNNDGRRVWDVRVPAEGSANLSYTVRESRK